MHRTNLSSIVMNMRQNATQIIYIYYLLKMDSIAIVQILSPSINMTALKDHTLQQLVLSVR